MQSLWSYRESIRYDGRDYKLAKRFRFKRDAQKYARGLRADGKYARVVRDKEIGGKGVRYAVYARG